MAHKENVQAAQESVAAARDLLRRHVSVTNKNSYLIDAVEELIAAVDALCREADENVNVR